MAANGRTLRWTSAIKDYAVRRTAALWDAVIDPAADDSEQNARIAQAAAQHAPLVWLLGKVQSGKTSIVRALTGCNDAEIGSGFKACTRTARHFDFPSEAPVISFLDTRGLGETNYDPSEDIAFSQDKAHLLLVAMKALDMQQDVVVETVRAARRRHPGWPVIVAQTCLHDAYETCSTHILPYPFHNSAAEQISAGVPAKLVRALSHQRTLFDGMSGTGSILFVPIDFTHEDDALPPQHYGLDALLAALNEAAPAGLASSLHEAALAGGAGRSARAHPHIIGHAVAAAGADLVPVAGLVAVPAVQAKLLHALALIYDVQWDKRMLYEFAGCLGTGTVLRLLAGLGIREAVKLVPVYGQSVGTAAAAATSFVTTFAVGKAAGYFLDKRRRGESDPDGVARTYGEALKEAMLLVKERGIGKKEGAA